MISAFGTLVTPRGALAPSPVHAQHEAPMPLVQSDDYRGYQVYPQRTMTPVGRGLIPVGWDLHEDDSWDTGMFPEAPDLMSFDNPPLPGHAPDGMFPSPTLGWSLHPLDTVRTAPTTWVIPRDRYYSRQRPLVMDRLAYRGFGAISPVDKCHMMSAPASLDPRVQEAHREAVRKCLAEAGSGSFSPGSQTQNMVLDATPQTPQTPQAPQVPKVKAEASGIALVLGLAAVVGIGAWALAR